MPKGLRQLHVTFDEPNLTHFGGMLLIHRFCKQLRLKWLLQKHVPFRHERVTRYHPADLLMAILYAMIAGISRLNATKLLQYNGCSQHLLGLRSFPDPSRLRRWLMHLSPAELEGIGKVHDWLRRQLFYEPRPRTSLTFDLDSTVLVLYGWQIEGAKIGYNPKKPRRPSYHPLLCFEGHTQDCWDGWLRPGDTHSASGARTFLARCLARVPERVYRLRVRADAGFFDHAVTEFLDERQIGYAIVARLTRPIQRRLPGLTFHRFRERWEAAEFRYQPHGWAAAARFIAVRRPLPDDPRERAQLTLWTFKRHAYHVLVTNLRLRPASVWRFYTKRAHAELNIRELKEAYPLAKIPTQSWQANEAYFHLILLAYDLVNWFRRLCLPREWRRTTLGTLRTRLLVLPARLVRSSHKNILRLPAGYHYQRQFQQILARIGRMRPW